MLNGEASISALARETGITEATLYRWREVAKPDGEVVSKTKKQPEKHSAAQKFAMVVETAALNEAELAEYCRKRGLYPEQLKAWRTQAEQAMAGGSVSAKALREAKARSARSASKHSSASCAERTRRSPRRRRCSHFEKKPRRSGGRQRKNDQRPGSSRSGGADQRGGDRRLPQARGVSRDRHHTSHLRALGGQRRG
jgi:transposase-like protein